MKVPTFRQNDIPIAIATLVQVLVVQLIDSEVLTVEEAEQVFDGAAKRSARLKDTAPDAERVIHHLHDALKGQVLQMGGGPPERRTWPREKLTLIPTNSQFVLWGSPEDGLREVRRDEFG